MTKRRSTFFQSSVFCLLFLVGVGYFLTSVGIVKNLASPVLAQATPAFFENGVTGTSFTFDGIYAYVHSEQEAGQTNPGPMKAVIYPSNQPYWDETYAVTGPPVVINNARDGTRIEVPCGYFQVDLIPQNYVVYQSPSFFGDRYGYPGDNVLLAAVNGERLCAPGEVATPTPDPNQKPTNVVVSEDDSNGGSIIQTYNDMIRWNAPISSTFTSGNNRYHVYISNSATFASNVVDIIRPKAINWYSTTGDATAIAKVKNNQQYYVRVCAEYNNGGAWDQQCAADVTYTKVPYQQATFNGATNQRVVSVSSPASCSSDVPNRFMGALSLSPNTNGYASSCTTTSSGAKITTFSCTLTLDNVNYNPDPQQTYSLVMNGGSSIYGCGGSCGTPGSCANVFSPNLDANQTLNTSGSQPLYVNTDLASSFFKVKNMSFYASAGINSPFPAGHQPFNSNDTGDDYFNQGSTGNNTGVGVVVSNGTQTAGLSSAPNSGISSRGWRTNSYAYGTTQYIGTSYITYAQQARKVTTISSLSDSAFTSATSGIFLVSGDLTLDNSNIPLLNGKYVIIMTNGTIRINADINSASGSVAFFANTLYINDAVTTVRAILSANTLYISSSASSVSTTPLSVVGSMSANTPIDMTKRARVDNDLQPSIFIQADPVAYTNLLPHLSNTKTEYQQIQ